MTSVTKNALVAYSAKKMFGVVSDVKKYPEFLPWCVNSDIISQDNNEMIASLQIDYFGLKQQFTTTNYLEIDESLTMNLLKGPFKNLQGKWYFKALNNDACKIDFSLDFEFDSLVLQKIATPIFTKIANTMLDSFINRAKQIYG